MMRTEPSRAVGHCGLAVLAMMFSSGCGPLTLDVSSARTLERTAGKMRGPMTVDDSARFEEALFYLVGTPWLGRAEAGMSVGEDELELLTPFDGRTAEGIVVEARRRRLSEVRSAVSDLESLRVSTERARRDLRSFRFGEARVYKRNRDYLEWPVIEFRIENQTNHYVSMVQFKATLLKPGDHNPWLVEDFDLVFFEGLAPGERGRWRIEPEQQEWIQLVDPHPDLEFVIEAMRLDAMGGRVLSASDWGVAEARRLEACHRTLSEIRSTGTLVLDSPPLPSLPPMALAEIGAVEGLSGSEDAADSEASEGDEEAVADHVD